MSKKIVEPSNEDTVQCRFFVVNSDMSCREELCDKINNTIKGLSNGYIWHKDEFKVFIPISNEEDINNPLHLCSNTCFGDNIEDEWFIVWLLLKISEFYQDLVIHVEDNDGDFLLIEAADSLQTWATPENTENRVLIYRHHIHIITPPIVKLQTKLDLKMVVNIVCKSPERTQAPYDIEQVILRRIGSYPAKMRENLHKAIVQLPSNVAALLLLKPSLIAPIVNTYCDADIFDKKLVKNMPFNDCVTIEITFTKYLYAMLIHSQLINSIKHYATNDKKNNLGLKIMCGFQMIMNKSSTNMFDSKEYIKFLENLKKNGYFQNNIEGSKEYNQLFKNAKDYYLVTESPVHSYVSHDISQLMSTSDYNRVKDSIKDMPKVEPGYTGDDDSWLNINPDQLNNVLLGRYGKTSKLTKHDIMSPQTVTNELSSILHQMSDYEGIEPHRNEEDNHIEFEADQFVNCIEKMLNTLSTGEEGEDTESEDSDDFKYDDVDVCDKELKAKLRTQSDLHDSNTVFSNIIQSMREEGASTGPTSNLLRTFGVHKSELLDSDDDDVD